VRLALRSAGRAHTIEAYLQSRGQTPKDVEPLSLDFYLTYVDWFQKQKNIQPLPVYIERLDSSDEHFVATTIAGDTLTAKNVVLAPGFRHFANIPEDLKAKLPPGSFQHTCDYVDFRDAADKRYLIIGGRQSAFEWAALLLESGAAAIHLSHRHASPAYAVADWSWVKPLVDNMVDDPSWFRRLSQKEKDDVSYRMWAQGRLKIEPWLESRLQSERVTVWPHTEIFSCVANESGELEVKLTNGEAITVDRIVLATGYKVDIARLPVLAAGNLLKRIETRNGFPVLDDHFETTVPGLFITSMPAAQDFGPFFGFTNSVRTSARLIIARLCSEFATRRSS
jgi:FAD-dependent urate hydroxylase